MTGRGPDKSSLNTHLMQTERLTIDLPTEDDVSTLYGLIGGEDRMVVTAGLLFDGPDDPSETLEFIERVRTAAYGDHGFNWAIRDRAGQFTGSPGTAMGMVGTRPVAEPGRGDVGYWLGRPHWGRGIMLEALGAVLDLCFDVLDLVKIEAEIFVGNDRSSRLAERVGMTLEGTIRSAHLKRGSWVDTHVYGLLREEWLNGRLPVRAS